MVQFTVDLPTQIFVTRIWACSKPLIPILLILLRCTESRISDCLETSTLEILQIAWFPEGKCISGNLSGYQIYIGIRNINAENREKGCRKGKFI